MRKTLCLGIILTLLALSLAACTISTSVGGASIEFGKSRNDKTMELNDKSNTFNAGEHFIYLFKNGEKFNATTLTIQLIDSASKKVLLTHDYQVSKDDNAYSDSMWFDAAGKYTVQFSINGKTRATQEVIIK